MTPEAEWLAALFAFVQRGNGARLAALLLEEAAPAFVQRRLARLILAEGGRKRLIVQDDARQIRRDLHQWRRIEIGEKVLDRAAAVGKMEAAVKENEGPGRSRAYLYRCANLAARFRADLKAQVADETVERMQDYCDEWREFAEGAKRHAAASGDAAALAVWIDLSTRYDFLRGSNLQDKSGKT